MALTFLFEKKYFAFLEIIFFQKNNFSSKMKWKLFSIGIIVAAFYSMEVIQRLLWKFLFQNEKNCFTFPLYVSFFLIHHLLDHDVHLKKVNLNTNLMTRQKNDSKIIIFWKEKKIISRMIKINCISSLNRIPIQGLTYQGRRMDFFRLKQFF